MQTQLLLSLNFLFHREHQRLEFVGQASLPSQRIIILTAAMSSCVSDTHAPQPLTSCLASACLLFRGLVLRKKNRNKHVFLTSDWWETLSLPCLLVKATTAVPPMEPIMTLLPQIKAVNHVRNISLPVCTTDSSTRAHRPSDVMQTSGSFH